MAGYTPGQQHIINTLRQRASVKLAGQPKHVRDVILKAAFETAKVEANYGNPAGGDGTSVGWRQETASSYPGVNRRDVAGGADRFIDEALKAHRPGIKSGDLAAMVQRPAAQYRGRYGQASGEAQQLLKGSPSSPGSGSAYRTTTTPGVDNSGSRRQLLAQYLLNEHQPGALMGLVTSLRGAQDTPATTTRTRVASYGQGASSSGYVNPFGSSLKAPGRIDEGVDPTIHGAIRAIGNARVVNISHNFYKGQPYIVYQLTDGPHAGKFVYVSELVTPHVRVGQTVRAGDVVATGHGPIETGWAGGPKGGYLPVANRAQGGDYTEGKATGAGKSFAALLRSLGAHASP